MLRGSDVISILVVATARLDGCGPDPLTYTMAALSAAYPPARRAMRVDPVDAMAAE
ncbi:MAG: hypothetical protein ABJE10_16625 [bacterium]